MLEGLGRKVMGDGDADNAYARADNAADDTAAGSINQSIYISGFLQA